MGDIADSWDLAFKRVLGYNPPRYESGFDMLADARFRAVADKTAVDTNHAKESHKLNEYGELPISQKIIDRLKLLKNPGDFVDKTVESFWKTHGDVLKERLGEFEGRDTMGDSLDQEHNKWYDPVGNKRHKEELRKAFDKLGKHRY